MKDIIATLITLMFVVAALGYVVYKIRSINPIEPDLSIIPEEENFQVIATTPEEQAKYILEIQNAKYRSHL
jgi:uncharacterized protein YxeA